MIERSQSLALILFILTSADNPKEIEHKIIYSILNKKPKRADIYWFVHVDTMDDPYTCEYKVEHIIPNDIIRVDFKLGFRIQPRIHILFQTSSGSIGDEPGNKYFLKI